MLTLVGVVDADLGAGRRRPARGRTHLPAAAPGGGPRRPRRAAGPGAAADLHPGASGDAGPGRRRPGDVHGGRGGAAPAGHWPPFGRLAALIVSADAAPAVDALARDLGGPRRTATGIDVLGPAPAPLAILRGRHRRRLLLKTRRDVAVQPMLREWLAKVRGAAGGAGGGGCRPGVVSVGASGDCPPPSPFVIRQAGHRRRRILAPGSEAGEAHSPGGHLPRRPDRQLQRLAQRGQVASVGGSDPSPNSRCSLW